VIGRCPAIEKLEAFAAGEAPRVERHIKKCSACQGVLALLVGQGGDGIESDGCARAEILACSREIGPISAEESSWLDRHASECASCAELLSS